MCIFTIRSKVSNLDATIWHNIIILTLREILITKRLLHANAFAIFVSNLVHILARYIAIPVTLYEVSWSIFNIAIYSFIFAYIFEIANQANSAEEDRLNKPSRPIPSGLLSVKQAYWRWILSWVLGFLIIYRLYSKDAMVYFFLWQLWLIFCYVWPKYDHWFFKNAFTGITAMLGCLSINSILSSITLKWKMPLANDIADSIWLLLSIHIQDFTEVKGDRAANRKTLPIILSAKGMQRLRVVTAGFFIASSFITLAWGWISSSCHLFNTTLPTGIINILMALAVAIRTFLGGSDKRDKMTYYVYYYLALFTHMVHVAYINLGDGCLPYRKG